MEPPPKQKGPLGNSKENLHQNKGSVPNPMTERERAFRQAQASHLNRKSSNIGSLLVLVIFLCLIGYTGYWYFIKRHQSTVNLTSAKHLIEGDVNVYPLNAPLPHDIEQIISQQNSILNALFSNAGVSDEMSPQDRIAWSEVLRDFPNPYYYIIQGGRYVGLYKGNEREWSQAGILEEMSATMRMAFKNEVDDANPKYLGPTISKLNEMLATQIERVADYKARQNTLDDRSLGRIEADYSWLTDFQRSYMSKLTSAQSKIPQTTGDAPQYTLYDWQKFHKTYGARLENYVAGLNVTPDPQSSETFVVHGPDNLITVTMRGYTIYFSPQKAPAFANVRSDKSFIPKDLF